MSTVREIISDSLRLINVLQAGEVPTDADAQVSLAALNGMLDSWSAEKLNIFSYSPMEVLILGGQQTYLLGPELDDAGNATGADWVTTRPMETSMLYAVLDESISSVEVPVQKLTGAEWSSIKNKATAGSLPKYFFDNDAYPVREISIWPVPTDSMPAYVWLWAPLLTYTTLDDNLVLPTGYERAMKYALAVELAAEFGKQVLPEIEAVAVTAKAIIKRLNSHPQIMVGSQAIAFRGDGRMFNWLVGDTI